MIKSKAGGKYGSIGKKESKIFFACMVRKNWHKEDNFHISKLITGLFVVNVDIINHTQVALFYLKLQMSIENEALL